MPILKSNPWCYQPGELRLYSTAKTPWIWLSAALSLLAGLISIQGSGLWLLLAGLFIALAGLLAVQTWLVMSHTQYIVTNQRIYLIECYRMTQLYLAKIDGVMVRQSPLGRLLHYGDVAWIVSGSQQPWIRYVEAPLALRQAVDQAITELEGKSSYLEEILAPSYTQKRASL